MVIQCPECKRRFELQRQAPKIFTCPKCGFSTSFGFVIGNRDQSPMDVVSSAVTNPDATPSPEGVGKTAVVEGLSGPVADVASCSDKTQVIPGLQKVVSKPAHLRMSFQGKDYGVVKLPAAGNFDLGRNCSDGRAKVKLTPDMYMSRLHAGMRVVLSADGRRGYQITSVKAENPVYVNNVAVPKGKACTLKNGDMIKMGETVLTFRV